MDKKQLGVKHAFEQVQRAKILMTDVERLTRISRQTLHNWRNGKPVTDAVRYQVFLCLADSLEKACDAGALPLKEKRRSKAERLYEIRAAIRASL